MTQSGLLVRAVIAICAAGVVAQLIITYGV